MEWIELQPEPPYFFFVPKDFGTATSYDDCFSLKDIFVVSGNGIKTDRDPLFFDLSQQELAQRMRTFYSAGGLEPAFRETYGVENSSSYSLLARRSATTFDNNCIVPCLYRPFDIRWLYYAHGLTSRPAWDVMRNLQAGKNLALLSCRQQADTGFYHVYCSNWSCRVLLCISQNTRNHVGISPLLLS